MATLVRSEGFEPSTLGAEIRYSIQLNYERLSKKTTYLQMTLSSNTFRDYLRSK